MVIQCWDMPLSGVPYWGAGAAQCESHGDHICILATCKYMHQTPINAAQRTDVLVNGLLKPCDHSLTPNKGNKLLNDTYLHDLRIYLYGLWFSSSNEKPSINSAMRETILILLCLFLPSFGQYATPKTWPPNWGLVICFLKFPSRS